MKRQKKRIERRPKRRGMRGSADAIMIRVGAIGRRKGYPCIIRPEELHS